jgi:hypothetical protein
MIEQAGKRIAVREKFSFEDVPAATQRMHSASKNIRFLQV